MARGSIFNVLGEHVIGVIVRCVCVGGLAMFCDGDWCVAIACGVVSTMCVVADAVGVFFSVGEVRSLLCKHHK